MASPWYSKADEHPRGVMRLRAGETYIKAFKLTQVDPDTLADIAAKDFSDYTSFYATFSDAPGGAAIVTTGAGQVVVQGDAATDGTLRVEVTKAQTQSLWDALKGRPAHASVWGLDGGTTTTESGGVLDLLFVATAAVLPATA